MNRVFADITNSIARTAGRASAFISGLVLCIAWAASGPIFNYSDTWLLAINTVTTIATFLMVFIIQSSQNRDGAAIQIKLNELIRTSEAKNSFVGIEHLTDEEIAEIRQKCEERAKREDVTTLAR